MEIFDVSVPIRPGMVVYPGDPEVELERFESLAEGGVANSSRLACTVHAGTHVDAPVHVLDGAAGVDALPLDALVGPARVLDLTASGEAVRAVDLEPHELGDRVLLRTAGAELAADAARLLAERGIRLVGIDGLSVGDLDVHHILLGAGVVPVEGLDLSAVDPGEYLLVCAPLRLVGSDGAPARVLLIRQ